MLPTYALIELYRAEKEALDLPTEPFPTFKVWKSLYESDWKLNHYELTDEEADAYFERVLEEAESLKGLYEKLPEFKITGNWKKLKIISKRQKAEKVFKEMYKQGAARKEVIKVFRDKIHLTVNGASTYYANCKRKFG